MEQERIDRVVGLVRSMLEGPTGDEQVDLVLGVEKLLEDNAKLATCVLAKRFADFQDFADRAIAEIRIQAETAKMLATQADEAAARAHERLDKASQLVITMRNELNALKTESVT